MSKDTTLQHHGVLGMHWGVRRYQNYDGTLTEAGKRKQVRIDKDVDKQLGKASNYNLQYYRAQQQIKNGRKINPVATAAAGAGLAAAGIAGGTIAMLTGNVTVGHILARSFGFSAGVALNSAKTQYNALHGQEKAKKTVDNIMKKYSNYKIDRIYDKNTGIGVYVITRTKDLPD